MPDNEKRGGAELYARQKQYDYKATSSLVLTSDNRTRDMHEPTGEPETLAGKTLPKMGDRVVHSKPEQLEERKKRLQQKREKAAHGVLDPVKKAKMQRQAQTQSVLDVHTLGVYTPSNKHTQHAYSALLSMMCVWLGEQPAEVLQAAAHEVLTVLKNEELQDPQRHEELRELLGDVSSEQFHQLVQLGKLFTDFEAQIGGNAGGDDELDEELGVAVEFGEEFDDEEEGGGGGELDEVMESSEEGSEGGGGGGGDD